MENACSGHGCERAQQCGRYIRNKESGIYCEYNYNSMGSGSVDSRGNRIEEWCGAKGDWKMFQEKPQTACSTQILL